VTLLNTDTAESVRFQRGDRIAQLVIQRVACPVFHEVDALPGSSRGDGGFGSTGGYAAAASGDGGQRESTEGSSVPSASP
jgi:dUTP pyrophosphatase